MTGAAAHGGGLLGAYGLLPLASGILLGSVAIVSLLIVKKQEA